jgi:hypothetical protein
MGASGLDGAFTHERHEWSLAVQLFLVKLAYFGNEINQLAFVVCHQVEKTSVLFGLEIRQRADCEFAVRVRQLAFLPTRLAPRLALFRRQTLPFHGECRNSCGFRDCARSKQWS